jgi:hypothetical protein
MTRLASLSAVSALLLATAPAGATTDCIRDEAAADTAARVFAASRICDSMVPAKKEDARHLAILFGAVRASDAIAPQCQELLLQQGQSEWDQVAARAKADQEALCQEVAEIVKNRKRLKAQLIKLNVLRPILE